MTISLEELRPHLQAFDFPRLFVEGLVFRLGNSHT